MKISKIPISTDCHAGNALSGDSGFTLLELIVSMTIISMIVVVLYFAFSMGVRTWERDDPQAEQEIRLEAAIRLIHDDLHQTVSYNMNHQEGSILLFAGGPRSVFYVTGNGTGAFSGAGAGLFFSFLYIDDCPDVAGECLFLYKSPRPAPEYIDDVARFRRGTSFQQEYFTPGTEIAEKSILIRDNLSDAEFSYSGQDFVPFAGTEKQGPERHFPDGDSLSEEYWTADELPGMMRIAFSVDEKDFAVQVPVGE